MCRMNVCMYVCTAQNSIMRVICGTRKRYWSKYSTTHTSTKEKKSQTHLGPCISLFTFLAHISSSSKCLLINARKCVCVCKRHPVRQLGKYTHPGRQIFPSFPFPFFFQPMFSCTHIPKQLVTSTLGPPSESRTKPTPKSERVTHTYRSRVTGSDKAG